MLGLGIDDMHAKFDHSSFSILEIWLATTKM